METGATPDRIGYRLEGTDATFDAAAVGGNVRVRITMASPRVSATVLISMHDARRLVESLTAAAVDASLWRQRKGGG